MKKLFFISLLLASTIVFSQDADSDGIVDSYDNCPTVSNPNQTDSDIESVPVIWNMISSSGQYNSTFRADRIADNNSGYWLLPDARTGWVQIDLGSAKDIREIK